MDICSHPGSSHRKEEVQPTGAFPAQTDLNPLQPNCFALLMVSCFRGSRSGGDSLGCNEEHTFDQHASGPTQSPGWTRAQLPLETPQPQTTLDKVTPLPFQKAKCHTSEQEPRSLPPWNMSPLRPEFPSQRRHPTPTSTGWTLGHHL